MSSSDFFDDDGEYDDAFFEELDAAEANAAAASFAPQPSTSHAQALASEDSFDDITFDFDEEELEQAERAVAEKNASRAVASTSKTRQTTLYGEVLQATPPDKRSAPSRTSSSRQAPKTKRWDHTAFAKSGIRKSKGKGRASFNDEPEEDQEEMDYEQFPAPFVSRIPPPPMKLQPDLLEGKHWIYPLNQPKRDYQYNIVKHCLFENTMVALPTGLGKTFVAGVVMLNFYRWFPEGRVFFLAPTKPLVAQQVEACHKTCGIPGSDALVLTGTNSAPMRGRAYKEKRVFYMTPQTLRNDLLSGNCDPSSVILIVIDEAHKATGDYAYNEVIRFMMAKNPHFRILALTATPGANPEAVQNLIDGLHISRIEIRDENSLDLKSYIHEKKVEQHVIKMTDEIIVLRDLLVKLMKKNMDKMKGFMHAVNCVTIHYYAFHARMKGLPQNARWVLPILSLLASLARAMAYLIEGTVKMCHKALQEIPDDDKKSKKGKEGKETLKAKLRGDADYQAVMKELERHNARGFPIHPKMDMLKGLILQHLTQRLPDDPDDDEPQDSTKIMVFSTSRPCVEEIVEFLNKEAPIIRASRFIGQGTDKAGTKGLAQAEQLNVIERFKQGEFNVLVATSIGEEGLDIGEIDLIVCYDVQKTPIRMLQRLGRTGRKREGLVHLLLSEGREEFNMDKAKDTYKHVQKTIWSGDQLELYADVERLLPDHIRPECLEKRMEIQEYVHEQAIKKRSSKNSSGQPEKKRKRNADVDRNIPPGTIDGFVTASKLVVKDPKKPRKAIVLARDLDLAGEDDDIDRELELGLSAPAPRRTQSEAVSKSKSKGKGKAKETLRKAKSVATETVKQSKKRRLAEPTPSQAMDDSDDVAIERGLFSPPRKPASGTKRRTLSVSPHKSDEEVVDLTDSEQEEDKTTEDDLPSTRADASIEADADMSWLIENDEDDTSVGLNITSSSPLRLDPRSSNHDTSILVISDDSDVDMAAASGSRSSPKDIASPTTESPFPLSYPVRPLVAGRKRKRPTLLPSDPPSEDASPSRRRRVPKIRNEYKSSRRINGVWDDSAQHSGDETSEGGSDVDSERDSDREFLTQRPGTQLDSSYAQTQVYRGSLMTQAPSVSTGPQFARPPQRRGRFGRGSIRVRAPIVSSSPRRPDDEVDEYEYDSFVVHDESQIVYEDDA